MNEGDGHAALADGSGYALDGAEPNVTAREDAGNARLQEVGVAVGRPVPGCSHVGAGEYIPLVVERRLSRSPWNFAVAIR